MNPTERYGFGLLAVILLIAAVVRVAPLAFEIPIGRDLAEYRNIAGNLRAGRGFVLDIKAYHAVETPVRHYSGYDRAPFLPVLLAGLGSVFPDIVVHQFMGAALYFAILVLTFDYLRRAWNPGVAFWVCLLLSVQSSLMEISLLPLTEIVTLFLLTLALWGYYRFDSPLLVGITCALLFLNRPNTLLFALVFAVIYAIRTFRGNAAPRTTFLFLVAFALGPISLMATNLAAGAPPFLTPQSFLFRVVSFTDQLHFFHENPSYESPWAVIAGEPRVIARRIIKNGFYYLKNLADAADGLGCFLPLIPLAAINLLRPKNLTVLAPLLAIGLIDLAFYTIAWATFDADRFLAVPLLTTSIVFGVGLWLTLSDLQSRSGDRWTRPLIPLVFLPIVLYWCANDSYRAYIAFREWRIGAVYSNNLESVWRQDNVIEMGGEIRKLKAEGKMDESVTIASNEPWWSREASGAATVLIPYDLRSDEWIPFLERYGAEFVLIQGYNWPDAHQFRIRELEAALSAAGWRSLAVHKEVRLWSRNE